MANQIKNMLIGLFVVIACLLIIGLILFVEPGVGDGKQTIKVHFTNINGIGVGTRVLLAGRQIGEVSAIEQIPQAREQAQDEYGNVYFYLVTMSIDSHITIFMSDKITISTIGLLGEKQINIVPQPLSGKTKHVIVTENSALYADSGDMLENVFNELSMLAEKVEDAIDHVIHWIDQYGNDLGSAVQSFGEASAEIAKSAQKLNELQILDQVHDAISSFNTTFTEINAMLANLEEGQFSSNLSSIATNVCSISASLAHGKGTIGRLINDDDLYIQASAAMSQINMLMTDINNYGLLFWYNKHWLRSKAQRIAAYNQLKNPQAFRYYLNKESDAINASLGRLTLLAEQAEQTGNSDALSQDPHLWKNLEELKQQLDVLQNNVQYYIQELNNQLNGT